MENPLKNSGLRQLIIRTSIFVGLIILLDIIIVSIFKQTAFYGKYLNIPSEFIIQKAYVKTTSINAALFGIIVFFILSYKKLLKIKEFPLKRHQISIIILAFIILISQYIFRFIINSNVTYFLALPTFWGIIKIGITLTYIVILGIGIFGWGFVKYFIKNYKKDIITVVGLSAAFFFLMLLVQNLWSYFSSFISNVLYHVFSLFFEDVTYKPFVSSFTMSEGGGPLLGINGFKAIIGKPCSGIDSFLLFTSLYTLIFILDYKKLKKPLAIGLFFVGAIGMFLTNILRILLLFIVGAYWSPKFAVGMFHTNAGWILFIVYFFVFWYFASKHVYKK